MKIKSKVFIIILTLILSIVYIFFFINNNKKENINEDDYKYAIFFIKNENKSGKWYSSDIIKYYDSEANLVYEKKIHNNLKKGLGQNTRVNDIVYSYGTLGLYETNLKTKVTKSLNFLKPISFVFESKDRDVYIVENSGVFKGNSEYKNTIYKNQKKIIDVIGVVNDFLVIGNNLYYQSLDIMNNTVVVNKINLSNNMIEPINCDVGILIEKDDKVFSMTKNTAFLLNDGTCEKFAYINPSEKVIHNQLRTYYDYKNNKSYLSNMDVILNSDKILLNKIEDMSNKTFDFNKSKYLPVSFVDGFLNINGKTIKLNSDTEIYNLINVYEK